MNKGGPGARRPKIGPRGHLPPGDFIALGSRGSRTSESELKPLQPLKPSQPLKPPQALPPKKPVGSSLSDRKRESSTPLTPLGGSKRPKLSSPTYPPHSFKGGDGESSKRPGNSVQSLSHGQVTPIEVSALELEDQVLDADATGDKSRVEALLLGAIKNLKLNKAKPDQMMIMNLMYLAKSRPDYFLSNRIFEALTSILKREGGSLNIKPNKGSNALVPMMACNILLYTFQEEDDWPESFVKVYVEDALGDRVWVDNEHCRSFVENIWTAFGTRTVPRTLSRQHSDPTGKQVATEQTTAGGAAGGTKEEDEVVEEMETSTTLEEDDIPVILRFMSPSVKHNIHTYILELVQDQLTRRQTLDSVTRNLLKLLTVTCGYNHIRLLVSQRLEMWLQNPKLTRPAQELLMSLALNCNTHSSEDVEVISNLVRMRLKTKPLANHYINCIKELANQHTENLGTVLKYVIYNELSNARNPNNMVLLSTLFQSNQEKAAKLLAMVFQDLLTNKEDYLRASRSLLREVVRALRHDVDFVALCRGFMKERTETQFRDLDAAIKERMLLSLADLITMATFLSITPTVKESFNSGSARGEKRDTSVLEEFHKSVSTIQRDAVWWLHIVVPKMFTPSGKDFLSCMNKVLFLDPAESYTGKDNWPPENDKSLLLSIVSEVPIQEDTLMRTIIIGLSNELPLTPTETLEIADSLVRRVAAIKLPSSWMQGSQSGDASLSVNRVELLDAVLNLCAYHHPKDIILPSGYAAPKLAIANLYWKAWILLAIVASLNPSSIGQSGWDNFPMLKCLMEILMTNNFTFPPPTAALTSEEKDEILSQELQLAQAEKEEILLFESHLAAATTKVAITESNSLLLSQLISMDPVGPARRPPQSVIDQLKATNKSLKLGQMLCRSRSPDFLLEIIQRQGASQSMPWLAELVQSSEGSLDVLPVQCLCEFLLLEKTGENNKEQDEGSSKEVQDKRVDIQRHVLGRLRSLLFGTEADADSTGEVLEYFMRRLSSVQTAERDSAVKGLELVLSQDSVKVGDHVTVVCEEELEGDAMITTMEELFSPPFPTASAIAKTYKWLLVNLPSLPHFETVRATCCFALRQSCQVEIISERTKAYLMFLAENCTDNGEEEFLATVIDIAQLIIERPTIMTPVLGEGPTAQETYQALLRLYTIALQQAIDMQEGSFSWQETQDQLFVQWSKDTEFAGKAATLHVLVIHAMIVLLTYGEPQGDVSLFSTLLNAWCPEYGQVKVYLTDTGEEVILLQEWLRLRMIRSQVSRVVDAALSELMPSQLVLFAQSFGIPVSSMSKLLQQLDKATEEDPVGIEEAVLDKGYMVQLVEVQQLRGAKGGDLFCCLLTGETPEKKDNSNLAALDGGITPLPLATLPEMPSAKEEARSVAESSTNKQIADEVLKIYLSPEVESSREHCSIETRVKKILTKELINANRGEIPEDSLAEQIMHNFLAVMDCDDGQRLLDGMLNKTALSCSILRLLRSRQMALKRKGFHCSFFDTISKLSSRNLTDGPLSAAISQYKKQLGIKEQTLSSGNVLEQIASSEKVDYASLVRQFLSACKHRMVKPDSISVETAVKACLKLKEANSPLYEDFLKAITKTLISGRGKKDSDSNTAVWTPQQSLPLKTCSEILVKLLKESDGTDSSRDHLSNGLLVDWSEIIDPEVVHIHPLLQRQLLFQDRESTPSGDRSLTGHEERSPSTYLLSLLAHQACWETLQDCLDWLLGQDGKGNRLNPTTALDFVWTCFHCPRLWQGRDQKSTAVGSQGTNSAVFEKPVLDLSPPQVSSLTGFILLELSTSVEELCERKGPRYKRFFEEMKDGNPVISGEIREEVEQFAAKVLGRRLQLITLCCHGDKKKFQCAVSCALNSSRWSKWFTAQFLVQLYLAQPRVMRYIKNFRSLTTSAVVSQSRHCQLDVLCHRVLSCLAESKPGKEYEDRAYNSSLLLKKLACEHPMLLLRHLPMIAAQLRGRVHLKRKEFTNQQHLLVFSHVLGVLDLLRPHIFRSDKLTQEGLRDTLEAYFGLIQGECLHHKELAAVVTKLMPFLQHFCAECPDQASTVLQKRGSLFQDLLQEFPALPSLQSVVSAISLSSSPHSDDPLNHVSVTPGPSSEGAPSSTQLKVRSVITLPENISWSSAQLAPFVQRLAPGQPLEDVLKVLGDLDETSKRRVDILDYFVPHLVRLLSDATSTCRTQAHTLLLRHIRQNPGTAVTFVETYMDCLNSTEPDVILTASKFLPEFIVLCYEYSDSLLQKMFSLAVYEAHDVGIPLLQSVQLLNLH